MPVCEKLRRERERGKILGMKKKTVRVRSVVGMIFHRIRRKRKIGICNRNVVGPDGTWCNPVGVMHVYSVIANYNVDRG